MFVVRKLDGELPFVFRLRCLISAVRFPESEARIFARGGAYVTDRAECRPGANESLPREKLLPVAADAGLVIGKVRGVGKISLRRPIGRELVTLVACEALVLIGRMQKCRIPGGRSARRYLRSRSGFRAALRTASLGSGNV